MSEIVHHVAHHAVKEVVCCCIEKKCCIHLCYPVPEPWGLIILLSNIFIPSLGTFIAAYCKKDGFCWAQFFLAIVQLICVFVFIGWCWAIWHGYMIYENSKRHNKSDMHVNTE